MRYKSLYVGHACAVAIGCHFSAGLAQDYHFDLSRMGPGVNNKDIVSVSRGVFPPGRYNVDVFINGKYIENRNINFITSGNNKQKLLPVIDEDRLASWGIDSRKIIFSALQKVDFSRNSLLKTSLDMNNQRLLISVPQSLMIVFHDDIAPMQTWNEGIPALLMNYSLGTRRNDYRGSLAAHTRYDWGQFYPGVNLGAWHLRNSSSWDHSSTSGGKWTSNYTFAERGLYSLRSRLVLGQRATPDDVFDSLPFTGVMLGTDENMVPFSERQFSPVIRGVARTAARVEIRQNGYTIYNTNVPPGPFAINDVTQLQDGGNLEVIVWETDGQSQTFIVPYQTPAIALHRGYLKYNLMGGTWHPAVGSSKPTLTQATLMYGLPWNLTGYGGLQSAERYKAASAGMGISLGQPGSLSLDVTSENGRYRYSGAQSGSKWRLRYTNTLAGTGTDISLTRTQYSSHYRDLADELQYNPESDADCCRKAARTMIQVSQSLQAWGAISLAGIRTDWRDAQRTSESYRVSYSGSFHALSFTLDWQRNAGSSARGRDSVIGASLTVPLDRWSGNNTRAVWQIDSPSRHRSNQQAGLSGSAFERQLTWDMREQFSQGEGKSSGSMVNASWAGTYGKVSGGYSYSQAQRNISAMLDGGMVIHQHGVTFGQPLTDVVALAEAPGAAGVAAGGWPGVRTDFRGYALLPYLSSYQRNKVRLDTRTLPDDAEIMQNESSVVPVAGAVIPVYFRTRIGGRALITIKDARGKTFPLGTKVTVNGQTGNTGLIDGSGDVYLSGLPEQGTLTLYPDGSSCTVHYRLPKENNNGLYLTQGLCH